MQKLSEPKKKISIFMYIFVYYLIIGSDCILFCYNRNEAMVTYAQYFMVLVSIVFFILGLYKKISNHKPIDFLMFGAITSLLISACIHNEFTGGYISILALFILGSSFFDVIDSEKFAEVFLNLMTVICIVSLFTFFFSSFVCRLPFFPSVYNNLNREYRFFFFSNISMINPQRNYGIFTEPSRFQAYLNLSLIFMLFTKKEKLDIRRIVLFIICLLTTFSTTGFIAFAIILFAFILSPRVEIKGIYKLVFLISLFMAAIVLLTQSEDFFNSINKITLGEKSHSAATRFNSFFATLKVISKNLLLGTGIGKADIAFESALNELGGAFASTNTMTILAVFSKFGLVPGLFYTVNMCKGIKNISNNNGWIILIVAFIAMTSGISFVDSILFNIIIFYPKKEFIADNNGGNTE